MQVNAATDAAARLVCSYPYVATYVIVSETDYIRLRIRYKNTIQHYLSSSESVCSERMTIRDIFFHIIFRKFAE